MKRRKFVLASGATLLGSAFSSASREPVVGLDFDLSADVTADPSTIDSVVVDFGTFELVPRYVDESAGDATITVSLVVDGEGSVEYSVDRSLVNGETVTRSDVDSMVPLVVDGIDTQSLLEGEVQIDVDHPSISDSYRQSFFISGDLVLDGLVGWWPLNDREGSKANDISGNQNDGNLSGGVTQGVWGRGGLTAYSFDGSDDYVSSSTSVSEIEGIGEFTISFWVRFKTVTDQGNPILAGQGDGWNNHMIIYDSNGDAIKFQHENGGSGQGVSYSPIEANKWYHAVAIYDGENHLYINGASIGSEQGPDQSPTISSSFHIGRNNWTNHYEDCSMTDVRVYDRALSESEVQQIYNWGSGDYTEQSLHDGSDSGAVSRYTFDGDVESDSWGSNTLTDNTSAGTTTDAIHGDAKVFDGDGDYMIKDGGVADGFSEFSYSVWVNHNTISNQEILNEYDAGSDDREWRLNLDNTDSGTWEWSISSSGTGAKEIIADKDPNTSWNHIVGTYDGEEMKMYINGRETATGTQISGDMHDGSSNFYIGRPHISGDYLDGKIDDVRIYDRALSSEEAFELYQWGTRGKDLRDAIDNYQSS